MSGCGIVGGTSATHTPTSTSTPTATASPTTTTTTTTTSTPTPTPTETPTPQPTETPTPPPQTQAPPPTGAPAPPDALAQGRTTVLRTPRANAASASAIFRGRTYPMATDTTSFWVPIGVGPEVDTGQYTITISVLDAAGALIDTRASTVTVVATDFPIEYLDVPVGGPNGLRSPDEVQQEENVRTEVYGRFSPTKLWDGPFIMPAVGPISTQFGTARSYNGGPVSLHHSGTDIAANEGDPVIAAAAGRVAYTGLLTTRGLSVIVDHGLGVFTAYHHLSRIDVVAGAPVAQGQQLGAVGMTGLATGPHLHWELVVGGQNVDPVYWTYAGVAP